MDTVSKLISDTLALITQKKVMRYTEELVDAIIADEVIVQDLF